VLPGKKYAPEEIVRILIRRAWLILLPLVLCTSGAVVVSKLLPNRYMSETLIMLFPQRIPDSYVKSTVTSNIEDRLATLRDQILSRSRLERIILDLGLYQPLRSKLPMEDVVQRMRKDIDVKVEGKDSFRVTYISQDAGTAQKTTERLASLFIEENLRDRENLAEDTNQFLDSQLEDARRRLVENEKKLEAYRSLHSGELPSQADANLQTIRTAQTQLQNNADSTDRAAERRLLLERQLVDLQSDPLVAPPTPVNSNSPDSTAAESTAQQLQIAQARLQILLTHDKPDHPDVRMMQRTIKDLEAKVQAEASARSGDAGPVSKPVTPSEALRQKRIRDLRAEIEGIDRQLKEKQSQDEHLRSVIADYQSRLAAVPKRESELVELNRDYATLQTTYQGLLAKKEDSKIAANLERRNIGEQFKVLDPARVPERPFSPNRMLIDLGGAAAGLFLGLGMIGLLEYLDNSMRSEGDVVLALNLPVLAQFPLIESEADLRRRRRSKIVFGVTATATVLLSIAGLVWKLRL
jgi:polysaccharide chain length determinant protein (PEP-CTERM system associated)